MLSQRTLRKAVVCSINNKKTSFTTDPQRTQRKHGVINKNNPHRRVRREPCERPLE